MPSSYPGSLDSFATNRADGTSTVTTHPTDHNDINDALNKIEAELGTNPKGGAATVAARVATISDFASPTVGPYLVNAFYDNSPHAGVVSAAGTSDFAADTITLIPFYTSTTFTIDQIGFLLGASVASSNIRIGLYATSVTTGQPGELLKDFGIASGAGSVNAFSLCGGGNLSPAYQILPGRPYYFGLLAGPTTFNPRPHCIALAGAYSFGLGNLGTSTTYMTMAQSSQAYASGLPDPAPTIINSQLLSRIVPLVRFRVSAVP